MEDESSSYDDDIIDDTGCEELMKDTYWDINYIQHLDIDDSPDEDEDDDDDADEKPKVREIRRYTYKEITEDGKVEDKFYDLQNNDSDDSYSNYSDNYTDSDDSDDSDIADEMAQEPAPEEMKRLENMRKMGINVDKDELYDPNNDEKNEEWAADAHNIKNMKKHTDAVLCCPSCFTTICYDCRLVTKGVFKTIKRLDEKEDSNVYVAKKVFNTYTLKGQNMKGTRNKTDKPAYVGSPLICSVCGNDIGFERDNEYFLLNMIEEDAYC